MGSILTLFFSIALLQMFPSAFAAHHRHGRQIQISTVPSTTSTTTSESTSSSSSSSSSSLSSSSLSSSSSTHSSSAPTPSSSVAVPPSSSSSSSSSTLSTSSTVSTSSSIPTSSSSATSKPARITAYSTNYSYITSTYDPYVSSSSPSTSPTGEINSGASNKGFLEDKGAVAGTFAVVGLVGLGIISALVFFLIKRQQRRRDEDEVDAYFDEPLGAARYRSGIAQSSTSLEFPPAHRQYNSTKVNYNDPQGYGVDFPPETSSFNSRPGSAAPGTAYAAALAHQGPYQYHGQSLTRPAGLSSGPRPLSTDEAYDPYYIHQ